MIYGKKSNLFSVFFQSAMIFSAITLLTLGCASIPKENMALKNARESYERAQGDPNIATNASVPLYEAGQTLKKAETAANEAEKNHLVYMAERRTAIAVAVAEQKIAEKKHKQLAAEKNRILLDQREQQARKARGEAQTMGLEAEEARRMAEEKRLEAEASRAQARQLEQELADLKAKKTDRGFVLTLGDVLFATGKAELMPGAQRTINQLTAFLHKYPEKKVSIEGHTDSVGSESYNLTLSQRRAESARSAIMARGIAPDRISAKGLGELYPVANNDIPAGRQQNRRVEILILPGE